MPSHHREGYLQVAVPRELKHRLESVQGYLMWKYKRKVTPQEVLETILKESKLERRAEQELEQKQPITTQ